MDEYTKLTEIKVKGYIVTIQSPLNYDIDLNIPKEKLANYFKAEKKKYTHDTIDNDLLEKVDKYDRIMVREKTSFCYRCRLKDIKKIEQKAKNQILNDVKSHLVCRDVTCYISDIDMFGRILVKIITSDGIDLNEYLIKNCYQKY